MVNNTDNSKLFEVVKQTLSNYEAPYNTADWLQMQSLLELAPKSKSFKFKRTLLSIFESLKAILKSKSFKRVFSPYMLISLVLLGGAYLLYINLGSFKTPEPINSSPQPKIEDTIPIVIGTETQTPVIPSNTPVIPSNTPVQDVLKADNKIQLPVNTTYNVADTTTKPDVIKQQEVKQPNDNTNQDSIIRYLNQQLQDSLKTPK